MCPTGSDTFRRAVICDGTIVRCPVIVALDRSMFTVVSISYEWYSCVDLV